MTSVITLPFGRPLTRSDLEGLGEQPDDGHRYELIDGVLIVSPGPQFRHQVVVGNLHLLLRQACPTGLQVLLAPFAVVLADDTEVQPDLIVAPLSQFTRKELPGAPLLAIEVLSSSTRRVDLLLKRDRLQAAGVPSYWLVDPDTPSVTVLELEDGIYVERAHIVGDEDHAVGAPFAVRLVPSELLS